MSGLDWGTIAPCAKWMEPYYQVVAEEVVNCPLQLLEQNDSIPTAFGVSHICPRLNQDDSHLLQTHSTSMDMFVRRIIHLKKE